MPSQAWTGEETTGDALLSTLQRLPHAEWVVTTLGSRGSVFLQRGEGSSASAEPQRIDDVLEELWDSAQSSADSSASEHPACTTPDGTPIRYCQSGVPSFPLYVIGPLSSVLAAVHHLVSICCTPDVPQRRTWCCKRGPAHCQLLKCCMAAGRGPRQPLMVPCSSYGAGRPLAWMQ